MGYDKQTGQEIVPNEQPKRPHWEEQLRDDIFQVLNNGPIYFRSPTNPRYAFRLRAVQAGGLEVAVTALGRRGNFETIALLDELGNLRLAGNVTTLYAFPYPPGR